MHKRALVLLLAAICAFAVLAPAASAQTTSSGVWIWPWDGTPYDPNTGEAYSEVPSGSEVTLGFGWLTAGYGNILRMPIAYQFALTLFGPTSAQQPILAFDYAGGRAYWGEVFSPPADWGVMPFNPRSKLKLYLRQWGVPLGVLPAGTYTYDFTETYHNSIVDPSTALELPSGQVRPYVVPQGTFEYPGVSFRVAAPTP
jgi:hypothetical protein